MILIALGSNLNSELYGSPLKNCLNGVKILRKNFFVKKVSKFYVKPNLFQNLISHGMLMV